MKDRKPMTPKRLRYVLKRLGLSQVAMAEILGVEPRTVRRWLAGVTPIPSPVTLAIGGLIYSHLVSHGINPDAQI